MNRFYRYVNGNYVVTIDTETGTKIRENNLDHFDAAFPESFDLNITNRCNGECSWCYQNCTDNGKHADLMSAKFLDTVHPYTEIAINGNDLSHPQLIPFLEKMKSRNVIVSMTVNASHFTQNYAFIKVLIDRRLIHGIGISYRHWDTDLIALVKKLPNAVLHMIAGIHTVDEFRKLKDNGMKILILGYKTVGRGLSFIKDPIEYNYVMKKIADLQEAIGTMIEERWFNVLSFDNIAIKQLEPNKHMPKEQWDEIFMGDDGLDGELTSASMYIDLVSGAFARNSCSGKRYKLMDNIDDMFQLLKNGGKENDLEISEDKDSVPDISYAEPEIPESLDESKMAQA